MNAHEQTHITKLQKKFPAIEEALARLNVDWTDDAWKDRLYIGVERVNQNLLHVSPELCDGKLCSLSSVGDSGSELLGWRSEMIYAVDSEHQIIGELGALRPDPKLRDVTQIKHLVVRTQANIHYLLQVTVTGWCRRVENREYLHEPALGELVKRDICITVYREPKESFARMLQSVTTEANLRLHFGAAHFGIDTSDPNVLSFFQRLSPAVRAFEEQVLAKGFTAGLPEQGKQQGTLGSVSFEAENWKNCNDKSKLNLKLSLGQTRLSFVGHDSRLQLVGVDATVAEALNVLEQACRGWQAALVAAVSRVS